MRLSTVRFPPSIRFRTTSCSDPYPHHEAMREAGPVVWLEHYGIWAMARHQEVRDALTDWQTYCSAAGVGLSDFRKEPPWRPPSIILEADPPLHTRTRAVLTRILSPAAINILRDDLRARGGSAGGAFGRAARIRRRRRSGRGLSAKSVSGCGRSCRAGPRKPAALWQHGVQLVRTAQRSVRQGDGQCRPGSRLDHVEMQPRGAGAGWTGHADFQRGRRRRIDGRRSGHAGALVPVGGIDTTVYGLGNALLLLCRLSRAMERAARESRT